MSAYLFTVTNRIAALFIIFLLLNLSGCGGSSSQPAATTSGTNSVNFNNQAQNPTQNINFTAGIPLDFPTVNSFDVAALGGPFKSVTIDATKALSNITGPGLRPSNTANKTGAKSAGATVQIYTGMSEEQDGLCDNVGASYQLLTVYLNDLGRLDSVEPSTFTASQDVVDIYNTGSVATCTRITTNVNAVASISGLEADYETCTEAPGNFGGTWEGTFICDGNPPEFIRLTVAQNGGTATYFDGEANYSGFICGDVYSFQGGDGVTYNESGKLVIDDTNPDSAIKTSSYRSIAGLPFSGSCTDNLTRQ